MTWSGFSILATINVKMSISSHKYKSAAACSGGWSSGSLPAQPPVKISVIPGMVYKKVPSIFNSDHGYIKLLHIWERCLLREGEKT